MLKEAPMTGNVALWTDGEVTIALANVDSACWADAPEDGDDEEETYRTKLEDADRFIIDMRGGGTISFDADGFREAGISFLRALSLYWETRS